MTNTFPYEDCVNAHDVDMDASRIEKVAEFFVRQCENGAFPGGQLVVRRKGQVVLKLSTGISRNWRHSTGLVMDTLDTTPFPVYSTGKPMAAILIAMLEDQGKLDINCPIIEFLPDFSGWNRENITIRDVLTHQAGILLPDLYNKIQLWADKKAVWQYLLSQQPRYSRGTLAYMPGEFGILLDHIVKQVTGKYSAELFLKEIAQPLGLNNIRYGLGDLQHDDIAWSYWLGSSRYKVAGMNIAEGFEEKNNDYSVFSAANPAFSMVSDAANLAAFYEFLINGGVTKNGKKLISKNILSTYTSQQISGWDKSLSTYLSLGYGFILGTLSPSPYGWWNTGKCFGHAGIFSSIAFGDYDTGLSVAIVTNGNKSVKDLFLRFSKISYGLRKACH